MAGHRSLLCLFSPTFAAVLAGHDQGEAVLKIFLEVGSIGLFAFHRYTQKEMQINHEDIADDSLTNLLDTIFSIPTIMAH